MGEVRIVACGAVGSGKSAVLDEIEVALRAIGLSVTYADPAAAQSEKNMTHADLASELERTKPHIVLVEATQAAIQAGYFPDHCTLAQSKAPEPEA
jgi:hypothetical protein